jgi:putative flippase GtrA
MSRWWKFNLVGVMGALVQLGVLRLNVDVLGMHYLMATALAVEAAVLHNYWWHRRWTWADRPGRLVRFHLANGAVSLFSNLVLMRYFTGTLHLHYLAANFLSICLTSVVNFLLSDRLVFYDG